MGAAEFSGNRSLGADGFWRWASGIVAGSAGDLIGVTVWDDLTVDGGGRKILCPQALHLKALALGGI